MKGGIIVRLIDVVFILLLGFITASDIVRKTQVKIPEQIVSSMGPDSVKNKPKVIRLTVQPTKTLTPADFVIIQSRLKSVGKKAATETNKFSQRWVSGKYITYSAKIGSQKYDTGTPFTELDKLEKYLIDEKYKSRAIRQRMILVILPDPEVMLQGVVNIFDICQRNHIEYHFGYPKAKERTADFKRWNPNWEKS